MMDERLQLQFGGPTVPIQVCSVQCGCVIFASFYQLFAMRWLYGQLMGGWCLAWPKNDDDDEEAEDKVEKNFGSSLRFVVVGWFSRFSVVFYRTKTDRPTSAHFYANYITLLHMDGEREREEVAITIRKYTREMTCLMSSGEVAPIHQQHFLCIVLVENGLFFIDSL